MSMPLKGGFPAVFNVTVAAGKPTVVHFTGQTNYLKVRASGAGTLAFASTGPSIALASAAPGSTSWEGPACVNGCVLTATGGSITVEIVAFNIA